MTPNIRYTLPTSARVAWGINNVFSPQFSRPACMPYKAISTETRKPCGCSPVFLAQPLAILNQQTRMASSLAPANFTQSLSFFLKLFVLWWLSHNLWYLKPHIRLPPISNHLESREVYTRPNKSPEANAHWGQNITEYMTSVRTGCTSNASSRRAYHARLEFLERASRSAAWWWDQADGRERTG
jgi:hypothetical protein